MNLGGFVISLLITIFFYILIPLLKFSMPSRKYSESEIKKFNVINSIVIYLIDFIICIIIDAEKFSSLMAPFIYYWLNNKIWINKLAKQNYIKNDKTSKNDNDASKNIKIDKNEKIKKIEEVKVIKEDEKEMVMTVEKKKFPINTIILLIILVLLGYLVYAKVTENNNTYDEIDESDPLYELCNNGMIYVDEDGLLVNPQELPECNEFLSK